VWSADLARTLFIGSGAPPPLLNAANAFRNAGYFSNRPELESALKLLGGAAAGRSAAASYPGTRCNSADALRGGRGGGPGHARGGDPRRARRCPAAAAADPGGAAEAAGRAQACVPRRRCRRRLCAVKLLRATKRASSIC